MRHKFVTAGIISYRDSHTSSRNNVTKYPPLVKFNHILTILNLVEGGIFLECGKAAVAQVKRRLADKYPGDKRIEKDPNVILVENFDVGSLGQILSRWDEVKNSRQMVLSDDVPAGAWENY